MAARSLRATLLLAVVVPPTVVAVAAVLKAGHWKLYADRYRIEITGRPRPNCPR
ncbi:hypothetical protein [Streptomyces sp. NEAU-Y11]|uniref:hypothetical protein n=1 Tax=Streptomyces cucumeris TaxID=2962890 RepID=UPI0035ABC793